MKVLMISPPGELFLRGEERCEAPVKKTVTTVNRFPIEIAYDASFLSFYGIETLFFDFAAENKDMKYAFSVIAKHSPDIIIIHGAPVTLNTDLRFFNALKNEFPSIIRVLKGTAFAYTQEKPDNKLVDILITKKHPYVLLEAITKEKYKDCDHSLFPPDLYIDRSIFPNHLYRRPDTNELQTTIQVEWGCPFNCTYCEAPIFHSKKINYRPIDSVISEIKECIHLYGIKNFFFRADSFLNQKKWVKEFCERLIDEKLNISWVANTRSDQVDEELFMLMKKAGMWLTAVGFESGSQRSLDRMGKGTTVKQNLKAARIIKKCGIKLYGFFMVGFPWEDMRDLSLTRKHILRLSPHFMEIHFPVFYVGTPIYEKYRDKFSNISKSPWLSGSYHPHLSDGQLLEFKKKTVLRFHARPQFLLQNIDILHPKNFKHLFPLALRLLKIIAR